MSRSSFLAAIVVLALAGSVSWADEIGPDSFATGFEAAAGYVAGLDAPGQPGDYPEQWFSWYGEHKAQIDAGRFHNGAQAVRYPYDFTDMQHLCQYHGDPNSYDPNSLHFDTLEPMVWKESFSFYISSEREAWNGYALRAEPWLYCAEGYYYAYQFFLWQAADHTGYLTGFEDARTGQVAGQYGWYAWNVDPAAYVTDQFAHTGDQCVYFPPGVFSDIQHNAVDGNPALPPMMWQDQFSIYIPNTHPDGEAFRSEPWDNWPDTGWSYQFFIFRTGLDDPNDPNGWFPQIGAGDLANDLRDELGMDPESDAFATDRWWTVTLTADGETGRVTGITIEDDFGSSYSAELDEPFSVWGDDLTDDPNGTWAFRPERLYYSAAQGDVYLDDIRFHELGNPPRTGWWPEVGWAGNVLIDEMGLPAGSLLEADKWWNVALVADGGAGLITDVYISDDAGTTYAITDLNEPFTIWGEQLDPNDIPPQVDMLGYASSGDGVWLDDVDFRPADSGGCAGDIDGDGDTDLAGLAELLASYNASSGDPEYNPNADFNEDGVVDLADLAVLLSDYNCGV